jgi:hypothetical protein
LVKLVYEVVAMPRSADMHVRTDPETEAAMREARDIMGGRAKARVYRSVAEMNADIDGGGHMAPKAQAELEHADCQAGGLQTLLSETREEELDFEPDTSHPDFRDFQATFTTADLDRRMDDIRSGRVKAVPWDEVKRRGDAVRNR